MGPWTQADLDKFGAEHGGIVRSDGPDSNGVVTHHMADGAYVTMLGNLPRMIGQGSPAQGEQQQAAPAQRPGGGMDQAALEAILNGWGVSLGAGDFREEVKQEDVPNPAAYDENGQYIFGTPLTIKGPVTYRTWVKPGTNIRLTVKVNQDGSYTQVFNGADSSIKPEAQQSGTKEGDTRGPQNGKKREVFRNGKWVTEDNPLYEQTESDRVGKPTGNTRTRSENGTTVKETEYLLPDGTREWRTQTEQGQPDRVGKPTGNVRERNEGGKKVKETEYILPDGTKEWRTQEVPGDPGSSSRVQKRDKAGNVYFEVSTEKDGKKEVYYENEKGERIPPPSDDAMAGVKGVPSFQPDLTKPGAGIVDRAKQLDELLASGRITWQQRQAVLESDVALAQQVAGEFNTATTLLREQYQSDINQRGQDISQANSRASLANTHHQNAIGVIEKFAPYLGVTPGDAGKMFMGMMASQLATATAYGGMADVPRVQMDPRLSAFVDRTLAGPQAPAAATVPPGPGEAPAPPADPQAAARAEAEAVRQAHRASGQPLPAPIFAPAPVTAPVQQAGNIPPGMMSPNPPDMTQTTAPVNPLPGQPGHDPTKPVGMAPRTPGFIEQVDWGTTPSAQAMATGEALFGKTLPPPPSSWRQDAEQQMFAMTAPNPQTYGAGAGLFGGSLPPAMTQAPGGMDYSLPPMAGGGGMDPIEQEARRQLAAAGVLV